MFGRRILSDFPTDNIRPFWLLTWLQLSSHILSESPNGETLCTEKQSLPKSVLWHRISPLISSYQDEFINAANETYNASHQKKNASPTNTFGLCPNLKFVIEKVLVRPQLNLCSNLLAKLIFKASI